MSKPRVSYYVRHGESGIIVHATSDLNAGDTIDDLRVEVIRGFGQALGIVAEYEFEDDAVLDPGTVDTTNMPPVD